MADDKTPQAPLPVYFGGSSASVLNPSVEQIQRSLQQSPKPLPLQSLLASAAMITSKQTSDSGFRKAAAQSGEWQTDAWAMYDLVGELRFVVDNLASRSSKAHFYVGKLSDKSTDEPDVTDNQELQELLGSIGGGQSGLSRIVERLVANLKVPGEGWLAGIPDALMPAEEETDEADEGKRIQQRSVVNREQQREEHVNADKDGGYDLEDYSWRMLSVSEVGFDVNGQVTIELGPTESEKLKLNADDIFLVRVHKPHPERAWVADSATRANLPVLRELVGLTMHISAQVDSRLAGAGVFIVPESYSRAVKRSMGLADDSPEDPVTQGLMEAMLTPIGDRAAASALVPLVLTVPDESADKFRHITFDKGLDTNAINLRSESIRRLALGLDCPPELLLGTNSMNHWGGWLMREDVVRAHIEPTLALVCDALTTQFLRPVIEENFSDLNPEDYVIWYDVEHLIIRASTGQDAKELYNLGEVSGDTLRRANGFDDTDAPEASDSLKEATDAVFEMVKQNPGLMRRPGIDVLVRQVKALLDGQPLGADDMVAQAAEAEKTAQDTEEATGVKVESGGDGEEAEGEGGESAAPAEAPTADAGVGSTPATSGGVPRMKHLAIHSIDDDTFKGVRGSLRQRFEPGPDMPNDANLLDAIEAVAIERMK